MDVVWVELRFSLSCVWDESLVEFELRLVWVDWVEFECNLIESELCFRLKCVEFMFESKLNLSYKLSLSWVPWVDILLQYTYRIWFAFESQLSFLYWVRVEFVFELQFEVESSLSRVLGLNLNWSWGWVELPKLSLYYAYTIWFEFEWRLYWVSWIDIWGEFEVVWVEFELSIMLSLSWVL